jgi:hypothetical protein
MTLRAGHAGFQPLASSGDQHGASKLPGMSLGGLAQPASAAA